MSHHNTLFSNILKQVPRHEFESLAKQHHSGRKFRRASRWSQFVALAMAQLSGRHSLRDVILNLSVQTQKLYHLGCKKLSPSNLSRINEHKPYGLYEALFGKLLARCQKGTPGHHFRFKNKLYSLDASTIDLCLSVFPWANFRKTKGVIKRYVGLDHDGYLPTFVSITDGKTADIKEGRRLNFPKGSIVACDRGYTDYAWYKQLTNKEIFFVSRLKSNARYTVIKRKKVSRKEGLTSDQTIQFVGIKAQKECAIPLRRIGYRDPETGKHYVFLTNHFALSAKTIADIYKQRWQIELFFKWIKQNLKIKTFIGTTKNAVLTQIWVAMCVYLLLALLRFRSKTAKSMQHIIRLLPLNLFEKRDLETLLRGDPPPQHNINPNQLFLV